MSYEVGTYVDLSKTNIAEVVVAESEPKDYDFVFKMIGNKLTTIRRIPVVFA